MGTKRLVIIESYPAGPRCFIFQQRTHHGATGCLLAAVGIASRRPALIAAGLALAAHDWHDMAIWFKRERWSA